MKIQLNISEDPNIYTIMDYIFATEEKYQSKDYEQLLAGEEAEGNGFGFVYMYVVNETVDALQKEWEAHKTEMTSDRLIRTLNRFEGIIREAVDKALQEYVFQHDGYIDSWPISQTEFGFEIKDNHGKSRHCFFDYFGSDIGVQGFETKDGRKIPVIGRDRDLVFRSGCVPQDTDEYAQMKARLQTNPALSLSPEYKRVQQENEEHHEQQRRFAAAWHREWFTISENFKINSEDFMDGILW